MAQGIFGLALAFCGRWEEADEAACRALRLSPRDPFSALYYGIASYAQFVGRNYDEAIRLADRIAIMKSGQLVQYDKPETVLSSPVNNFVRDFVGSDRALKRISRIGVRQYIKPVPMVKVNTSPPEAIVSAGINRWLWVVDDGGRLIGWADKDSLVGASSIAEVMTRGEANELSLKESATLREALSRMLGLGFKYIPVTDDEDRLIGEVALHDVEAATTGGED